MMDYCPRPDYSKYEPNSTFYGSIVSAYSKTNNLVYCVDAVNIKNFMDIDEFKSYKKLTKRPRVGMFFVYYCNTRMTYYRVFHMGRNPVEPKILKAYFLDTGEVDYVSYNPEKNQFFELPDEFYVPVMGLFCQIINYPKQFKSTVEFIEECTLKKIKFKVCGLTRLENALGSNEECLIVDAEVVYLNNASDCIENNSPIPEDNVKVLKLTKSSLMRFDCEQMGAIKLRYSNVPFMSSRIPESKENVQPNQKILIYPGMLLKPNLLYGNWKSIHHANQNTLSLSSLMIKMNRFNVIYEKLDRIPIINEMVVVREEQKDSNRYYRGQVLEIFEDIYMILYVDYGYTRPYQLKNLFKFPLEFSKIPFHTSRIHITNIDECKDLSQNHTNMIIVHQNIMPLAYGIVEKADGFDIFVKLYNNEGFNLKNILMRVHRTIRIDKCKTNSSEDEKSREKI